MISSRLFPPSKVEMHQKTDKTQHTSLIGNARWFHLVTPSVFGEEPFFHYLVSSFVLPTSLGSIIIIIYKLISHKVWKSRAEHTG